MRVLGLVTARGGSKGFPGKNLATLAGRPLVAWAHHALAGLRARHPELLLHLSTDSAEIAAAWPEEDRPQRLRPAELAQDLSTSIAVIDHELAQFAAAGKPCDAVLLLQPTSPLATTDDLDALWSRFVSGSPAVVALAPTDHPVQWNVFVDEGGQIEPASQSTEGTSVRSGDSESAVLNQRTSRQALRPAYRPVGFYLATTEFLHKYRAFVVPGLTASVVVDTSHAIDIDHARDLDLAQACLARRVHRIGFALGGKKIGDDAPCFVIAEAGVNHNGDPALAMALVRAAAASGADAVKFQTFRAKDLVTASARKAAYQQANTGADEAQRAMLERLELGPEVFAALKAESERLGLVFLSTPFDHGSARFLAKLGVAGFKLGSGDLTNLPLLAEIAGFGRPVILSTGMASLDEVEDAAAVLAAHGDPPRALLHCVSCYPAPASESNLRAMRSLECALGGPVGMSDHSMGGEVTLAAVALGAKIIEKHLTLDRRMSGPDHSSSLEPAELETLMRQLRRVESALGDGIKRPVPSERDTRAVARRSLMAARDLAVGALVTPADVAVKRPGDGLAPRYFNDVVGRVLAHPITADEPFTWAHLAPLGPR